MMKPVTPLSSYRLQFRPEFTFADAQAIIPYLRTLGVSHLYASPVFTPRSGSSHGYDVADPTRINPQLGDEAALVACAAAARSCGIGWIQDIVPNHMVFSRENPWLMDVLESGPVSAFAGFFDIEWNHLYESLRGRVLAPFLGRFYGECLEAGEIVLGFDRDGLHIRYYDHRFPLRVESYFEVLGRRLEVLRTEVRARNRDLIKFFGVLYTVKNLATSNNDNERAAQLAFAKEVLWELYSQQKIIHAYIDDVLADFNNAADRTPLDQLLATQYFRLAFWKVATEELDYRRFFTVNDLICLKISDEQVFKVTHEKIFEMIERGIWDGLRIDHIDGLHDPLQYLERLRCGAPDSYVVVEKILGPAEGLPSWPVHGTTGYDALNAINGLFYETRNRRRFDRIYHIFTGEKTDFASLVITKRRLIIGKHMAGDIDNLAHQLKQISSRDRAGADITLYGLRRALVEVLACFPVYRSYVDHAGMSSVDHDLIAQALDVAIRGNPGLVYELQFIRRFMLLQFDATVNDAVRMQWCDFVMRVQQFTGPLAAKGVEDTTLYIYNRMIGLNEVGSDPDSFGSTRREVHAFFSARARHWPQSMNTLSTHDTKRGADVRARLAVLSEMPAEWLVEIKHWRVLNRANRIDPAAPDANDEYFFYQTIVGSLPLQTGQIDSWRQRIEDYMIKAVREAKVHTAWLKPDSSYEEGVREFVRRTLRPDPADGFWSLFLPFAQRVAWYGMLNSLSQTALALCVPGVPDIYQGSELWDLTLVDPDNRREVDYHERRELLDGSLARWHRDAPDAWDGLLTNWHTGAVKQLLIARLLQARACFSELFLQGSYLSLRVQGRCGRHCFAFMRRRLHSTVIVMIPRFFSSLVQPPQMPLGEEVWGDTRIEAGSQSCGQWHNWLTREPVPDHQGTIMLADAIRRIPVAVLVNREVGLSDG